MSDFLFRTFGGFRSQSETVVYPIVYYASFGGVFFPKVMDPSRETTRIGTFLGDRDREQRLNGWWVDEAISYRSTCVCVVLGYIHVDIFQLQLPRGTTLWKVGWKVNIWILYRHGAISTGKWCLDHVVVTHPLGRSRMPVIRGHGSSNATGFSVQRNSAGNQSENCHHKCPKWPCPSKSHSSPCCCWLLNFEYQLYIDVIFPSVFHNFKISPKRIICCRYWGFNSYPHLFQKPKPPSPPQTPTAGTGTTGDPVLRLLHLCRFGS